MLSNYNDDDIDYLYIINNLFIYLQSSPLSSLSFLSNPYTLISLCYEINKDSFQLLMKNLSKTNSYGLVYSDISDSINKMQSDLQNSLNSTKEYIKINIVELLNNNNEEQKKLSKLLIGYVFCSENRNIKFYEEKMNHIDKKERANVMRIIDYFKENDETNIVYVNEYDSSSDESVDYREVIESLKREITELKRTNAMIVRENESLKKTVNKYIEDKTELKEKFDKLLIEYEQIKESSKDNKENSNESLRTSFDTNPKWDLTEQEYLKIILKKDAEIQKLKELLEHNTSTNYIENDNRMSEIEETYQKEMEEMTKRYDIEFELIASALYNIGQLYHKLKNENEFLSTDTPSWLIKQRQRYLNGDC